MNESINHQSPIIINHHQSSSIIGHRQSSIIGIFCIVPILSTQRHTAVSIQNETQIASILSFGCCIRYRIPLLLLHHD